MASLDIRLALRGDRTVVAHQQHYGPLRLQRPFFPEGPDYPHLYLLHPPGGMAAGDSLTTTIHCESGAGALFTTPSANKIYGTDSFGHQQSQITRLVLESGSFAEWLPQETIVFDNANGIQSLRIEAQAGATFFAWDLLVLGREGSAAPFVRGQCRQVIEVTSQGKLLLCEQLTLQGQSDLATRPWGLQGKTVSGIWVCGSFSAATAKAALARLRNSVQALVAPGAEIELGLTSKDSLLIGRVMGNDIESIRQLFCHCWSVLRPELNGRQASLPRIWAT